MEKIIINDKSENQRLDKYLRRYLPNAGTGFLYKMLREKKIKLNSRKADPGYILKAGDEICIYFADDTLVKFKGLKQEKKTDIGGTHIDFAKLIVFENEDVLLINKPAGMLSQKAEENDISACEYLVEYLKEKEEVNEDSLRIYRPSAVNRLDRNTSGLLVCAKTLPAAQQLSQMFKDRTLKKEYLALVYGRINTKQKVRAYLKKNRDNNKVEISTTERPGYERIETVYEPLGQIEDSTLLMVELITGKTHQIRAHLSAEGHPIIGDIKYSSTLSRKSKIKLKRQFLHAFKISFPKCSGVLSDLSDRVFKAELPHDLEKIISGRISY